MFFLVGAGDLSEAQMLPASIEISRFFNFPIIKIPCKEHPVSVFNSIIKQEGIFQLIGDPGITHFDGGSWLEALGAWRTPIVLLVKGAPSGEVPGQAAAYFALASSFAVPVIGLVQLGGTWKPKQRLLDGLPWCGYLSDEKGKSEDEDTLNLKESSSKGILVVGESIKRRFIEMDL